MAHKNMGIAYIVGDISRFVSFSISLDNDAFFDIFTEDETPTKSTVLGRPVLLALEDVDGAPSFLEKALRFVENHGISYSLSACFAALFYSL